jgi:hypothetical protein
MHCKRVFYRRGNLVAYDPVIEALNTDAAAIEAEGELYSQLARMKLLSRALE